MNPDKLEEQAPQYIGKSWKSLSPNQQHRVHLMRVHGLVYLDEEKTIRKDRRKPR